MIWFVLLLCILLTLSIVILRCEVGSKFIEVRTLIKEYSKEMFWASETVDNTSITIIPDCGNDVVSVLYYESLSVENAGGGIDISVGSITPGNSDVIYTDGTDTLTLSVAANGSVTIQRTAGAEIFTVVIEMKWI